MTDDKFTEFKKDLKRLLKKYDAEIYIDDNGFEGCPDFILQIYILGDGKDRLGKEYELLNYSNKFSKYCVCDRTDNKDCECKDWDI